MMRWLPSKSLFKARKKSPASAPSVAATGPVEDVDCFYRLVWGRGPQGEDIVMDDGSSSPKTEDFIRITSRSTGGSTMVKCDARLQWNGCGEMRFFCVYFEDSEWTNKDDFGEGVGGENGCIEDVSISMREKSYNETGEAVEKEILDDSGNRFLVVVMAFVSEKEKGTLYGKKVEGAFGRFFLSTEEKKRLQLD